jgi:hypoxanthine phosphoribosyltransferase
VGGEAADVVDTATSYDQTHKRTLPAVWHRWHMALPNPVRENLTWDLYHQACRSLAQRIADDDFVPDIILGIARGGLFAAASLGYALGVKNLFVMNVEFYTGVDSRLEMPVVLPPVLNAVDLSGARVLVADDVADTGATLQLVKDFCADHVADVRCAVIYEKPRSEVHCEYVWKFTDDWINFPWSVEDPVVAGAVNTDA